jgi:hypothetical protein
MSCPTNLQSAKRQNQQHSLMSVGPLPGRQHSSCASQIHCMHCQHEAASNGSSASAVCMRARTSEPIAYVWWEDVGQHALSSDQERSNCRQKHT